MSLFKVLSNLFSNSHSEKTRNNSSGSTQRNVQTKAKTRSLPEKYRTMTVELLDSPKLETTFPIIPREGVSDKVMKKTDYNGLTCSCEPWHKHRSRFPLSDSRRLCRHLRLAIDSSCVFKNSLCVEIEEELLDNFFPRHHFKIKAFLIEGEFYYLLQEADERGEADGRWINVYAKSRSGKKIERFGFNLVTGQWSFGSSPKNSPLLKHLAQESFELINAEVMNKQLLPPLPASAKAIIGEIERAKKLEEARVKEIERDLEKHTRCYVCENILPMTSKKPFSELAACDYCGSKNYRTQSGRGITAERLELYHRYDGERGRSAGIFAEIDEKFKDLREQARSNLSKEDYKKESRRLTRERAEELEAAEERKSAEIRALLQRERGLKKQFPRLD